MMYKVSYTRIVFHKKTATRCHRRRSDYMSPSRVKGGAIPLKAYLT